MLRRSEISWKTWTKLANAKMTIIALIILWKVKYLLTILLPLWVHSSKTNFDKKHQQIIKNCKKLVKISSLWNKQNVPLQISRHTSDLTYLKVEYIPTLDLWTAIWRERACCSFCRVCRAVTQNISNWWYSLDFF